MNCVADQLITVNTIIICCMLFVVVCRPHFDFLHSTRHAHTLTWHSSSSLFLPLRLCLSLSLFYLAISPSFYRNIKQMVSVTNYEFFSILSCLHRYLSHLSHTHTLRTLEGSCDDDDGVRDESNRRRKQQQNKSTQSNDGMLYFIFILYNMYTKIVRLSTGNMGMGTMSYGFALQCVYACMCVAWAHWHTYSHTITSAFELWSAVRCWRCTYYTLTNTHSDTFDKTHKGFVSPLSVGR